MSYNQPVAALSQRQALLRLQDEQAKVILDTLESQFGDDATVASLIKTAKTGPLGIAATCCEFIQGFIQLSNNIRAVRAKQGLGDANDVHKTFEVAP